MLQSLLLGWIWDLPSYLVREADFTNRNFSIQASAFMRTFSNTLFLKKSLLHICRGGGRKWARASLERTEILEENWIICCDDQASAMHCASSPLMSGLTNPRMGHAIIPLIKTTWKHYLLSKCSRACLSLPLYPISYHCIIVWARMYLFFFIVELCLDKGNTSIPFKTRRRTTVSLTLLNFFYQDRKHKQHLRDPCQLSVSMKTLSDLL